MDFGKPYCIRVRYYILLLFFFLFSSKLFSQSIFTNPINGNNPSSSNPFINQQVLNSNLTVSGIGFGSGLIANAGDDRYNLRAWSTGALLLNDYIEFTLTPNASFKINFTSFVYGGTASTNGPENFVLRSSLDNYASNIASLSTSGATVTLSSTNFQNVTTSITFRIYGYNAITATGTFSINDFTFNGYVTPASPTIPIITSTLTANSTINIPATSYTITASNFPASYNATNLPTGLSINTNTGKITGTPTSAAGSPYNVTLSATNAAGTGYATLVHTISLQTCSTLGMVNWDFESQSPNTNTTTNLIVSNITRVNNNGTTLLLSDAVPSEGYSNSSGGYNIGAATINGTLSSNSTYFEFTLTPATNYSSQLYGLQFGSRSTTTGPINYAIKSSLDNYTTNIASGSLINNSTWAPIAPTITSTQSGMGTAITYRIYGYNGTGANSNIAVWRLDDLQVQVEMIRANLTQYALTNSRNIYCAGGNGVSVGLNGSQSGVNYQLVLNGNTNIGNAVQGTGSAISFGLQTQAGTHSVNAVYDNTTCLLAMANPFTLTINTINTWTGVTNSSWDDVSNWSCGILPNASTTEIIIPSSALNQPSLNSDVTIYGNLNLINAGSILSINGQTLTINGTILGLGSLSGSETSNLIVDNGSGENLNLTMNSANQNSQTLNNYTQNRNATITLTNSLLIKGLVNLSGTSSILSSNGYLTLLSTANSTSGIGYLGDNANVSGNVNVQSYFTGGVQLSKRGTRMISFPVFDNQASPNYLLEQIKNQMFFTGQGNTSNGFDLGGTASPNATTMVTQVESRLQGVYSFDPIENILTRTIPAKAYFLFYRGDRINSIYNKLNAPFADPENVTLTYKGTINKGDIQINVTHTNNAGDNYNGICAIGNPYPAVLDFDSFLADNSSRLEDIISIIKPDRTGQITKVGNVSTNDNFNVTGGSVAQSIRYIQPCQSFYIRVKSGESGLLTFKESHKSNIGTPSRLLSKPDKGQILTNSFSNRTINELHTNAVLRMSINDGTINNETAIIFKEDANENYSGEDAILLSNSIITCGTLTQDGVNMAINMMPIVEHFTTIKLMVNSENTNPSLKLIFTGLESISDKNLILKDKYLNVLFPVTTATNTYAFGIDKNIASSFGTERFEIYLEPIVTLPISFISFNIQNKGNVVLLKWKVAEKDKLSHFQVEKSLDGVTFHNIAHLEGKSINGIYTFVDNYPDKVAFYRIKQTEKNGNLVCSKILSIKTDIHNDNTKFSIYPNPTKGIINIKVGELESYPLEINICNYEGKSINNFIINSPEINQLDLSNLVSDLYILQIRNGTKREVLFRGKIIKD